MAHIQIAKVEDIYKTTKTFGSNRVVELLLPAIEAINQQIELTFESAPIEISVLQSDNKTVKKQMFRPIFVNTCTSLPHCNYHSLRDRFWVNHLKNAKVRYRSIGNTRHTYASQLLSTGAIPKEWITKQLGHTSTKMIDKHYGKWISEDAPPMTDMANKALGF